MAMEPMARHRATLVDLLDRVLDHGVIINADIIITLAGVPLVGINLRAALAGMDTMTKYGVMSDWDERIRAEESGSEVLPGHQLTAQHAVSLATATTAR
ncbi:MAG: gas vesicle protein [Chloroflexota bacterium]